MRGKKGFRVYQSRKDASGLLLMSAGGFSHDSEQLYEDRIRLQSQLNQLKASNQLLHTQLARLQSSSPQRPQSREPFEALVRDLQGDLAKKDLEIVQLKREVQYYKLTDYEDRLQDLVEDRNGWKTKAERKAEEAETAKARLLVLERDLREKERRLDSLSRELASVSENLKDANARRSAVEDELVSRSDLKKLPALKSELLKVRSLKDALEADKRRLLTALNSKNSDYEDAVRQLEANKAQIEQLESQLSKLKTTISEGERSIEEAQRLLSQEREQSAQIERQLTSAESEKDQLRRQAKNLGTSLASKAAELAALQALHRDTVETLQKQLQTLAENAESEINALRTENKVLQSTVVEQGKRLQASDEVEFALRERVKELVDLQKGLETTVEDCRQQISTLVDRLQQCEAEKEATVAALQAEKAAEVKAISVLFEKLPRKLRKKDKSPSDLFNQFSDTALLTRKDLKRAFKAISFKPKKAAFKAAFLLLGDSEGKIAYSVLQQLCNQPLSFPDDLS